MGGPAYDVGDVLRMLGICAPGFEARVTRHSLLIRYGGKIAVLPKGPGVPRAANVQHVRGTAIPAAKVRKVVQNLGLDRGCVNRVFPGLIV